MVNKYNKKRKVGLRSASMRALAAESTTSSSVATVNNGISDDRGVVFNTSDCGKPNVRVYDPYAAYPYPNRSFCSSKIIMKGGGGSLSSMDLDTIWENEDKDWTPAEICKVNPNSILCNYDPSIGFSIEACYVTNTCN